MSILFTAIIEIDDVGVRDEVAKNPGALIFANLSTNSEVSVDNFDLPVMYSLGLSSTKLARLLTIKHCPLKADTSTDRLGCLHLSLKASYTSSSLRPHTLVSERSRGIGCLISGQSTARKGTSRCRLLIERDSREREMVEKCLLLLGLDAIHSVLV